jgi:hypothetical protein
LHALSVSFIPSDLSQDLCLAAQVLWPASGAVGGDAVALTVSEAVRSPLCLGAIRLSFSD